MDSTIEGVGIRIAVDSAIEIEGIRIAVDSAIEREGIRQGWELFGFRACECLVFLTKKVNRSFTLFKRVNHSFHSF